MLVVCVLTFCSDSEQVLVHLLLYLLTIYTACSPCTIQYLYSIYTLSVQVLVAVLTKVLFVVLVLVNIWCSVGNLELAPQNDGNI